MILYESKTDIELLSEKFKSNQKILLALGDENRQHLILEMMKMEECYGVRVGEITQKTHLSRPAVSHHLKILKEAGIINMRREGTKNYYYFDVSLEAMDQLLSMIELIKNIMKKCQTEVIKNNQKESKNEYK